MRKIFSLLLIFTLNSCHFPKYYFENSQMETGLDFTKGKWILNNIDAPYDISKKLSDKAFKDFSKFLNNRISHANKVKEFLITPKINLKETPSELLKIQKNTGYDYLIDLKSQIISNKVNMIEPKIQRTDMNFQNKIKISLDVYDLKSQTLVYSKTTVGYTAINNESTSSDVEFSASKNMLVFGAYKKIINDITKKSIYK